MASPLRSPHIVRRVRPPPLNITQLFFPRLQMLPPPPPPRRQGAEGRRRTPPPFLRPSAVDGQEDGSASNDQGTVCLPVPVEPCCGSATVVGDEFDFVFVSMLSCSPTWSLAVIQGRGKLKFDRGIYIGSAIPKMFFASPKKRVEPNGGSRCFGFDAALTKGRRSVRKAEAQKE